MATIENTSYNNKFYNFYDINRYICLGLFILVKFCKQKINYYQTKIFLQDAMSKRILYIILLITLVFNRPELSEDFNQSKQFLFLIILFISVLVHLKSHKNKNWGRIDLIFLFSFIVVHFQWVIMLIVGVNLELYTNYELVRWA